ncbi:MAG: prepilin-type N-terminal cleavage/methylation domain-containing protein [Clostridium celatum]|uniref:prepilin-type N-terminal cleavage/methylation domain-containing protein n=1 Tax=uncultured Clostridium sp. TaxID=59620 RepID=UPI0025CF0252|nr:prepilin-type N-terminal cleavage/methylation domain-containing protein [uncultured Clostridium sp.]MDU4882853.1 prepilin-type N-terminal cleavage/methylation domain-containing protein [Clostridium celatum]MDU5261916.1 prepilin-type N-terminal cleavage/methylation domain-containing protein [Clostridium celatum]MDU7075785.1 prepilin-type N-terminal cleavage/methylation domain-containing protein [Clostridium celatum]
MKKRKGGYTLIEVIAVLAILLLLGGITITLSYETIGNYFINVEKCYSEDKFDNALLNIDSICNSNGIISIEENKLFVDKLNKDIKSNNIVITFKDIKENIKIKIIYLQNEKLVLRTLNYDGGILSVGNNTILDKVDDFKVKRKKNLIYYYIENKENKVRGRCI